MNGELCIDAGSVPRFHTGRTGRGRGLSYVERVWMSQITGKKLEIGFCERLRGRGRPRRTADLLLTIFRRWERAEVRRLDQSVNIHCSER